MDNANNRNLILGGGFVAVLALFLMGCPGPMPGTDTGTPPDDGGMPPDSDVPPPDSGMPPDDGGMNPDGGMSDCTDEMMRDRVTPPCDPDIPEGIGPGTGPTGMEDFIGLGTEWYSPSGLCTTDLGSDPMGRIWLLMYCPEFASFGGLFYYGADGRWYYNRRNGHRQDSAELELDPTRSVATGTLFRAGEETPYQTVTAAR